MHTKRLDIQFSENINILQKKTSFQNVNGPLFLNQVKPGSKI